MFVLLLREKASDKPKVRDILPRNQLGVLNSDKVRPNKENLRKLKRHDN
jgi:hypothetical protein